MSDDGAVSNASGNNGGEGVDTLGEEDRRTVEFREHYKRSEALLMAAMGDGDAKITSADALFDDDPAHSFATVAAEAAPPTAPPKKPARTIDEDDYGDDDDDDEDNESNASPLKSKGAAAVGSVSAPDKHKYSNITRPNTDGAKPEPPKTTDEVRKKLEQDKKATEDAARRSFHTTFYTYETDRDAMLEQQKLDELDRQVEAETGPGQAQGQNQKNGAAPPNQPGTLSGTNLGGSVNLTLKHLIARIDQKRNMVNATDTQLRTLMSEVRKNRSKWANEDKVGQEELYESMEKVLMELKAMTEHAGPFLQKVNKRDAPDYHQIIKHPMDIGTMLKKLKGLQYKSKKEFVDDLMLIWSNCLKYNGEPTHFLRKKALHMKKETDKLVPLIPDIVVRDRAEMEAEERRTQNGDIGEPEDSEDEEPIMASRGRKAPSKSNKSSSAARKAPPAGSEGTPGADTKPPGPVLNNAASNLKNEFLRADSDAPLEGSINGFSTPPPGSVTPFGANGVPGSNAPGSQVDFSELDGAGTNMAGLGVVEDADDNDLEYKTWKLITKKDRARIASERHRRFKGDALDPEQPAILRSKAGMRRWLRRRKQAEDDKYLDPSAGPDGKDGAPAAAETLAEGIEEEDDRDLPDYYDPVCAIPDVNPRLRWVEDSDGQLVEQSEDFLRVIPKGAFKAPTGHLSQKVEDNMRQMQDTRKICAKIGVVKQMQLQAQMYQNQFQKYDPVPFVEQDVEPMVVTDDGPVMSKTTCRAALQRSVGKIFYHAGFEEFQPSALEAITDIASNFFSQLATTLQLYGEFPKVPEERPTGDEIVWNSRFTEEESILHALDKNGIDMEGLESYVKDDVERLGTKLLGMHERMKYHLAELLRPALDSNAGADGAGAFNDGSEQFVSGDFAEDFGEDYFGFRELGLDQEFGLAQLSVPLHLLQNRMHHAYQAQHANTTTSVGTLMDEPATFEPVTTQSITQEIGIIQGFFLSKLHDHGDQPLVEDDNLPAKQRFPKPRLPPTGKISSPRKRPIREQQQLARKKRKLEESKDDGNANAGSKPMPTSIKKLKLDPPANKDTAGDPEKDDASAVGMMSPESIAA
ncbi:hypothetical protein EJ05DRAFT_493039 [Pseudovirgaria hyperparasitica]|uniref:SAGA complex subunit Spt7 n=1 Tax=Pseudovirgaria hyperparasitica TaxID=470096 RepID=A0A6A6W831_9PEZI|nr:uncharacterized protein EJ05DRAFT_493039 [Pseudovirgaria hyperparasitica]KAF2758110.1 hypothetical protein EJ05DRAFT_493039 [Pseudovirgaria hyperparasitica]